MKKTFLSVFLSLLVVGILVGYFYISIPYYIDSKGIIMPVKEYILKQTGNGTLISVQRDYLNNITTQLTVNEFQRGDLAVFIINENVLNKKSVCIGDTIGVISSIEEERQYANLLAELQVQKSLLQVYSTGQKPEDVKIASENVTKAEYEYETQKKVTERNKDLYDKKYIPAEEYELSLNQYQLRKQDLNIARLNHESVRSGAKQEQLNFVNATIKSLEVQISQLEKRLRSFNILSPVEGIIMNKRNTQSTDEIIINISDVSEYLVVIPVDIYQLDYISAGQEIELKMGSYRVSYHAKIIGIDNSVQIIDGRQKVLITAQIDGKNQEIISGLTVDASIKCGKIEASEYMKRLLRIINSN